MMFTTQDFLEALSKTTGPPRTDEIPNGDGRPDTGKRYWHLRGGKHFDLALSRAREICVEAGVPSEFWPDEKECCLRLLEYPPGCGSEAHTDFDLFTINCYRSCSNEGLPEYECHWGELEELALRSFSDPRVHYVAPMDRAQFSMVFFVLPRRSVRLLSGVTVGEWLDERYARSRA